jgi:hypothetical protein
MQAFPLKVLEVEEELRGNSADVEYARKLLGFPEHTTASASLQSSVAPSLNLNSHYMTTAIQRIMAYRVLDVMHWVKQGGPRKEGELRLPRSYLKGVPTLEILVGGRYFLYFCQHS